MHHHPTHDPDESNGKFFAKKKTIIVISAFAIGIGMAIAGLAVVLSKTDKQTVAISALKAIEKVSRFLPIADDEKKELEVVNTIVEGITKKDGKERAFLVLLQNDSELRPGGGFLGQYAIIKIKDGQVVSTYVEDSNLLDQRITVKIPTPYPFERMMQLKKWKFRDSNFSPDFPTNVEKAKYFFRLAGGNTNQFQGVIAVNSKVFDDAFGLTGPITVPGYNVTFSKQDASRKLEEIVEKRYLMNSELDTQNRKDIMKKLAPLMMDKLFSVENIPRVATFVHEEMKNRNIMLNFTDQNLQKAVESVNWDGSVPRDWIGDYLMAVDANMGALKSDYYIKREMTYDIDFTGEKPVVHLTVLYKHTAPYGDWRTSDYHSYLRLYLPKGAKLLSRQMVNNISTGEEFNKTYIGFMLHVLIGQETKAEISYELPDTVDAANYRLLMQKQSGAGDVSVAVHVKMKNGEEFTQNQILKNDLRFDYKNE